MKRFVKILNLFPTIKGRVWVDVYSVVALYRFVVGKPVDTSTLALILGTYAVSKIAGKYVDNTDRLQ